MPTTNANTKSPSKLREEYGPSPWWSEDHLAELIHFEELTPTEIADIWNVHPDTIADACRKYGTREVDR